MSSVNLGLITSKKNILTSFLGFLFRWKKNCSTSTCTLVQSFWWKWAFVFIFVFAAVCFFPSFCRSLAVPHPWCTYMYVICTHNDNNYAIAWSLPFLLACWLVLTSHFAAEQSRQICWTLCKEAYLCVGATPPSVSDQDEFGSLFREVFKKNASLRYCSLICREAGVLLSAWALFIQG